MNYNKIYILKIIIKLLKVISAFSSSMAVIDAEEGAFGPGFLGGIMLGFDYIVDDGYSIFVEISDYSLMSVGGVAFDGSVFPLGLFGWLGVGEGVVEFAGLVELFDFFTFLVVNL